jgi:hypothetical protein
MYKNKEKREKKQHRRKMNTLNYVVTRKEKQQKNRGKKRMEV